MLISTKMTAIAYALTYVLITIRVTIFVTSVMDNVNKNGVLKQHVICNSNANPRATTRVRRMELITFANIRLQWLVCGLVLR
jgi:hypothetical protein